MMLFIVYSDHLNDNCASKCGLRRCIYIFIYHYKCLNIVEMYLSDIVCVSVLLCLPLALAIGPLGTFGVGNTKCDPSMTTSSGTMAIPKSKERPTQHCAGDLIFEDTFDIFDLRKWQHENTLSGGRHTEFQWYTNNRTNTFCEEGFLNIRPSLTSDLVGESYLYMGSLSIHGGTLADQ